jgi:hypothetical protein
MSSSRIDVSQSNHPPDAARQDFRQWLRKHRQLARETPLRVLLNRYARDISSSAAYRAAVDEGVRGLRSYRTRYAGFWNLINWELPDGVLESIWGVARGNLRQRRLRTAMASPLFVASTDACDPRFIDAIRREKQLERRYDGPRPV